MQNTDLEVDLFAAAEASVEDLPETGAAGWSSTGTISTAATATGGTLSSLGTTSSYSG
ncbi:thiocillin family RiPP [Kitasatospora aureofaciens]|uniref:thiocillin family RiPP n=1 Tax=Kitasatospora aureofaciens TaxID=1894 RepID=UPI0033F80FA9